MDTSGLTSPTQPAANFNGLDSFIYQLCDVDNDCDTALMVIR
jgi:hypothetical protein